MQEKPWSYTSTYVALLCLYMCECVLFSEALTLCCIKGLITEGVFSAVGHVQKAVLVFLLVVQLAHSQTATHSRNQTVIRSHTDSSRITHIYISSIGLWRWKPPVVVILCWSTEILKSVLFFLNLQRPHRTVGTNFQENAVQWTDLQQSLIHR